MPDLEELRENFEHFDSDDDGRIDRGEFKRLMSALGAVTTETEQDVGFDAIDLDDDGAIDFREFAQWWMNH
jgi:Ca2+-binding EF-hand superfamily protein